MAAGLLDTNTFDVKVGTVHDVLYIFIYIKPTIEHRYQLKGNFVDFSIVYFCLFPYISWVPYEVLFIIIIR